MKGGKTYEDRIKSSEVREKVLDAILAVYSGRENKLSKKQWELTLRMATTVLPRLNEHAGEGGGPLQVELSEVIAKKHGITSGTEPNSGG